MGSFFILLFFLGFGFFRRSFFFFQRLFFRFGFRDLRDRRAGRTEKRNNFIQLEIQGINLRFGNTATGIATAATTAAVKSTATVTRRARLAV